MSRFNITVHFNFQCNEFYVIYFIALTVLICIFVDLLLAQRMSQCRNMTSEGKSASNAERIKYILGTERKWELHEQRTQHSLHVNDTLQHLLMSNRLLVMIVGGPLNGKIFHCMLFFFWPSELTPTCPSPRLLLPTWCIVPKLVHAWI
jgi:hypothetical protein